MPVTEQLCDSLYAVCFFPSLVLHMVYSVYDRKSLHFVTNVALFFFLAEAVKTQ